MSYESWFNEPIPGQPCPHCAEKDKRIAELEAVLRKAYRAQHDEDRDGPMPYFAQPGYVPSGE